MGRRNARLFWVAKGLSPVPGARQQDVWHLPTTKAPFLSPCYNFRRAAGSAMVFLVCRVCLIWNLPFLFFSFSQKHFWNVGKRERERMGNWRTHSRWPCLMWLRSSRNETFLDSEIAVCPQRVEEMVSEAWNPGPSISSNYLSFLSLSPPREEGGMLFTTEFSLKGFLFSCAPSLRYWNYFLLFNPPPVEKLCEIRGVGFQVYSFRWCCIFTPNHRVCLSFCSFCFM